MGSDFANFHAGCHGPVPLRGLFRSRTSRRRSRTIDQSQGQESTGFSVLGARSGKRRNRRGIKRFPSGPPRTKAYLLVGFHWVCVASLDVGGQSPERQLILAGRWFVAGRIQVRDFITRWRWPYTRNQVC